MSQTIEMCFLPDTDLDLETDLDFPDDFESPQIDCEYPMYAMGGYHPVHLGDLYDDGRYRIVHKIGAGDTSMIWLARDSSTSSWVALKILMADQPPSIEENIIRCHDILAHHHQDKSSLGSLHTCDTSTLMVPTAVISVWFFPSVVQICTLCRII